jgi:iron complex transport system substrate-binding protein
LRFKHLKQPRVAWKVRADSWLFFQEAAVKRIILMMVALLAAGSACNYSAVQRNETITLTDQLGRTVAIPKHMTRIAALYHFCGRIVFALGQRERLVEQSLSGKEAKAMASIDAKFASMPRIADGHGINFEHLLALKPQCAIVYASFNKSQMTQLENAGIKVIAVKGETLEESIVAVRLIAKVLGCEDKGEEYLKSCENLKELVANHIRDIPRAQRLRVIFTGPKSIFTVATGEMLQNQVLELAGAVNVAASLKGFWNDVSPEQIAAWNPDVILLGSSLDTYAVDEVLRNSQFQSIKAVRNKRVYVFPSNVGWWDYPAPHCVLGAVWTAKTLYPDQFQDVDVRQIADDFYAKYLGHTFTSMGGKL